MTAAGAARTSKPVLRAVRSLLKFLLWGLLAIVVLAVVANSVLALWAGRKEKAVRARWAAGPGSLEAYQAAIPETQTNGTAKDLEAVASELGIGSWGEQARPAKKPWTEISESLTKYVWTELADSGPATAPAPPTVAAFLESHQGAIAHVRHILIQDPPPIWEERRTRLLSMPTPNGATVLGLTKLLVADALTSLGRRDTNTALSDGEVTWRLCDAFGRRPDFLSLITTFVCQRYWVGIVRKFEEPLPAWPVRLQSMSPRRALVRAFQGEACRMLEMSHLDYADLGIGDKATFADRLSFEVGRPYARLSFAYTADTLLDEIQAAQAAGPCSADLEPRLQQVIENIPRWNVIAQIALPNELEYWGRADKLQLDVELTRVILLAQRARTENRGIWPESLSGIEPSACSTGHWNYVRNNSGIAIAYSAAPAFPWLDAHPKGLRLPLKYEVPIVVPALHRDSNP